MRWRLSERRFEEGEQQVSAAVGGVVRGKKAGRVEDARESLVLSSHQQTGGREWGRRGIRVTLPATA